MGGALGARVWLAFNEARTGAFHPVWWGALTPASSVSASQKQTDRQYPRDRFAFTNTTTQKVRAAL
ncbi:MAG: hypothetical protein D6758_05815 [Gammaproteobacteria bacterium]|nr:MAG: hypothetical protein D6758_05815 [Gammaproteobacteria bacterium]